MSDLPELYVLNTLRRSRFTRRNFHMSPQKNISSSSLTQYTHGWVLYSSHQGYCSTVSDIMISVGFSWGYPSQTQSLRVGREQESPHLEEGGLCRRGEIFARTNIPSDSTCKACWYSYIQFTLLD